MNIFISHSWAHPGHYECLAKWIFDEECWENLRRIHFYDASVPKDDPIHLAPYGTALKQAIYQRIHISDVVVIPTGMYATHSDWIQKEIEGAKLHVKPIIAVNPWGQKRKSVVVAEAANELVGWNRKSIINAILWWGILGKWLM